MNPRDLALAGIFWATAKFATYLFLEKLHFEAVSMGVIGMLAFLLVYARGK